VIEHPRAADGNAYFFALCFADCLRQLWHLLCCSMQPADDHLFLTWQYLILCDRAPLSGWWLCILLCLVFCWLLEAVVTSALFVACNQLMTTFFSPDNIWSSVIEHPRAADGYAYFFASCLAGYSRHCDIRFVCNMQPADDHLFLTWQYLILCDRAPLSGWWLCILLCLMSCWLLKTLWHPLCCSMQPADDHLFLTWQYLIFCDRAPSSGWWLLLVKSCASHTQSWQSTLHGCCTHTASTPAQSCQHDLPQWAYGSNTGQSSPPDGPSPAMSQAATVTAAAAAGHDARSEHNTVHPACWCLQTDTLGLKAEPLQPAPSPVHARTCAFAWL